jgi:hypothetical protein
MQTKLNDTGQAPGRLPLGLSATPTPTPDFTAIRRAKTAAWLARNYRRPAHWPQPSYFQDLARTYASPLLIRGGRA